MIVTTTGWTLPELNATPWPDVMDLLEYWASNPPLHRLVAIYLGVQERKDEEISPEQFIAMAKGLNQ